MNFTNNVFVNCPFDEGYRPLLQPLLFTISYLKFSPRIALEQLDSGSPRIDKIIRLIQESRLAIHDLSRSQAKAKDEYYRLNMPFELGIDVGCRLFGTKQQRTKRCLIIEEQRYRYQAALSDLSGSDIAVHGGSQELLVTEVRNWLAGHRSTKSPGPARMWGDFLEFVSDNYDTLKGRGFSDHDIQNLPIAELIDCIEDWLKSTSTRSPRARR